MYKFDIQILKYKRDYGKKHFKNGFELYLKNGVYRYYTHLNRVFIEIEFIHELQNIYYWMTSDQLLKH